MVLKYYAVNNKFKHSFTISKGTKTHQPSLVVSLEHLGHTGYGEAPAIAYYKITVDKMIADIQRKKVLIERFALIDPERYWHYLHHLFPDNPFLVCALDMAAWDLFGKMKQRACYQLWGQQISVLPLTDYTIGIDTIGKMVEKMKETPWPVYKIKLGTSEDIKIVTELRKYSDSIFRIDANAGWETEEALEKISALAGLGVELVEQPLDKDNWQGMEKLFLQSSIPLFADESCVSETDVDKCNGFFHGINIKLTKCSGITPARRMIANARNKGLKIMLGTMNETSVGSAAIAQLANQVDYLDMDGTLLLEEDTAESIKITAGKIQLSDAPGLGITKFFLH